MRIALRDRRELCDILGRGGAESLLARLARAEDLAGAAETQVLLGNPEAVGGLAHQ